MQLKCFGCFGEYRSVGKIACAACVILAFFLTEHCKRSIHLCVADAFFFLSSLFLTRFTYFLWIVTFKNVKLILHISPWFSTLDIIVVLFVTSVHWATLQFIVNYINFVNVVRVHKTRGAIESESMEYVLWDERMRDSWISQLEIDLSIAFPFYPLHLSIASLVMLLSLLMKALIYFGNCQNQR